MTVDERDHRLTETHVAPLMELVYSLRCRGFDTPNVDPNDGGVNARALFLLESPGPRAVGTGYISQDNPDPSAANMRRTLSVAGFYRNDVFLWNVVPYCVSSTAQNRNASNKQIICAVPETQAFIDKLQALKVVVFCGKKAQAARPRLKFPPHVLVYCTFHPGAQSYNHERCRLCITETFKLAYAQIST